MRLNIEEILELKRESRIKYVLETGKSLIRMKKLGDTYATECKFNYRPIPKIGTKELKANISTNVLNYNDADSVNVKVVANTSNWIDYQLDLILPGAPKKSILENKGFIPFMKDHSRDLDDRVAIVNDIYEKLIPIRDLGIDIEGTVSALIFDADIVKKFNEKTFWQYIHKQVNQHSIGLRYVDIRLCVDNQNSVQEYENYKKYIKEALNPQVAEESGFFFAVPEYKLIENSCVLFGANKLTPTLQSENLTQYQTLSNEAAESAPQKTINTEPLKSALDYNFLMNNFKL